MIQYDDILDQNPWWEVSDYFPVEGSWHHRNMFQNIKRDLSKDLAIVITGLRRTGKSTVLYQLIEDLLTGGTKAGNIFYFEFDKYALDKSPEALEFLIKTYLERRLGKKIFEINNRVYLFIDEIQYIDYWQDIVKRYYDRNKNLKFILTGSQSTKLKSKSKESLAGRLIEYHFPALDFGEYLKISGKGNFLTPAWDFDFLNEKYEDLYDYHYRFGAKLESQMPAYLCYGQFPETAALKEDLKFAYEYIKESVLGKILEEDIPKYYGIEKVQSFKNMAYHLITNSGSIFEIMNIGSELGIAKTTAEKYLAYLKEGFLIEVLHKYLKTNIKRGRVLKKAYSTSTNFIAAINNFKLDYYDNVPEVFGKLIETYVWQRLVERFENLALWRSGDKEVDFVVPAGPGNKEILLIEVKFSSRIRNTDLKAILSLANKKQCSRIILVTKDKLDKQVISGVKTFFIPYYLM